MVDGVVVERHEARIAFEAEVRKRDRSRSCRVGQRQQLSDTGLFPIPARGARERCVSATSATSSRGRMEPRWTPCTRCRCASGAADRRLLVEGGGGQRARCGPRSRVEASPTSTSTGGRDRYVARTRLRGRLCGCRRETWSLRSPGPTRERGGGEGRRGGRLFRHHGFPGRLRRQPLRRPGAPGGPLLGREPQPRRCRPRAQSWPLLGTLAAPRRVTSTSTSSSSATCPRCRARSRFAAAEPGQTGSWPSWRASSADGATNLGASALCQRATTTTSSSATASAPWEEMPPTTEAAVPTRSARTRGANHPVLGELARRSGGEYFNLLRIAPAEAAERIGSTGLSLLSVEYDPTAIADVTPAGPQRSRAA